MGLQEESSEGAQGLSGADHERSGGNYTGLAALAGLHRVEYVTLVRAAAAGGALLAGLDAVDLDL